MYVASHYCFHNWTYITKKQVAKLKKVISKKGIKIVKILLKDTGNEFYCILRSYTTR